MAPETWLVDGFNLLHTVILGGRDRAGWWKPRWRREVTDRLARFEAGADRVRVVFDGSGANETPESGPAAGPEVVFAPSADDWILREVRRAEHPERLGVVTADRPLRDRCRHAGAVVVHPRDFLARCGPAPQS